MILICIGLGYAAESLRKTLTFARIHQRKTHPFEGYVLILFT